MLVMAWGFDNHVIDVYFNAFAHQITKDFVHQSLVGCSGIFKTVATEIATGRRTKKIKICKKQSLESPP